MVYPTSASSSPRIEHRINLRRKLVRQISRVSLIVPQILIADLSRLGSISMVWIHVGNINGGYLRTIDGRYSGASINSWKGFGSNLPNVYCAAWSTRQPNDLHGIYSCVWWLWLVEYRLCIPGCWSVPHWRIPPEGSDSPRLHSWPMFSAELNVRTNHFVTAAVHDHRQTG